MRQPCMQGGSSLRAQRVEQCLERGWKIHGTNCILMVVSFPDACELYYANIFTGVWERDYHQIA